MAKFSLKNKRLLQVDLANEKVMARSGAMVAYVGQVKFEKAILGGEGIFGALKRKVTSEGLDLMTSSGTGTVYYAHEAREINVIPLTNEKVFLESSTLIAFDSSLKTNTAFAGLRGAASGQGLFTTTVEGVGNVAIFANGGMLAFEVTPQAPLCVDPDAFLGYKGSVTQEFVFDVNWLTMVGQTSGESYQLRFSGQGIVYIQGSERR